jgi:signal transduction histidine kinase
VFSAVLSSPRTSPYPQLALTAAFAVTLASAALFRLELRPLFALSAGAIIVAGAIVMLVAARRPPRRRTWTMAIVPILDIIAVALFREATVQPITAIGLLLAIPLSWLAFAFALPAVIVGVLVTITWPALAYLSIGEQVTTFPEFFALWAFPTLTGIVAFSVYPIGVAYRREHAESVRQTETVNAILASTVDAITVFDSEGSHVRSNAAAEAMSRRAGWSGERAAHVYATDRQTALPSDALSWFGQIEVQRSASRTVWLGPPEDQVAVRYSAARIGEGGGVVVTGTEVTGLVTAVETREAFIGTLNHELRSPLTVLLGETDLALENDGDCIPRERVERIEAAATRLRDTVGRLLTTARRDISADLDTTDAGFAVQRAVDGLRPLARSRGVTLSLYDRGGVLA